ncbi:MAG: lipopolysaccharide kinase InaA family protein [Gemmatimonadales bacterium]
MTEQLPGGYRPWIRPGVRAFAREDAVGWLEDALTRHGTLQAWSNGSGSVALAGGRGVTRARPAPRSGPAAPPWVCRHYRRGGRLAPLLDDRYLAWGIERPLRELRASAAARARGVRTPAVVAGAAYGAGPFYRADLVTEHVTDARSLADALHEERDGAMRRSLLRRAGSAVRDLELARLLHADASAGNILLQPDGPAWVIDLDRCAVLPAEAPAPVGPMRERLERSMRKLSASSGRSLNDTEWAALRAGFEDGG